MIHNDSNDNDLNLLQDHWANIRNTIHECLKLGLAPALVAADGNKSNTNDHTNANNTNANNNTIRNVINDATSNHTTNNIQHHGDT